MEITDKRKRPPLRGAPVGNHELYKCQGEAGSSAWDPVEPISIRAPALLGRREIYAACWGPGGST